MKITKHMSWLKLILVLSIVCSFALTATAQDYYPTTIGNTWVFLSTDGAERRTYSIEEAEGEVEGIIILRILTEILGTDTVDDDVYYISDDGGDLLLHRTRLEEGTFGIAAAILDPPTIFFPADLPLGRTWDIVTQTELDLIGTANTTSTIEVVALEDLETPGGTFNDCVKLQIDRKSVTALITVRTTSYQWLAPDVGPVKFENDQGIVYEVQSYNVTAETSVETPILQTPTDIFVNPVNTESPAVGEQFNIDINIGNGAGVSGYNVTVNYDPTALKYVSSVNGDYLPAGASVEPATVSEDSVQLSASSSDAVSDGHGTLTTITFEVVEAKASTISLTDVAIYDAAGVAVEIVTGDGEIFEPIDREPIVVLPPDVPLISEQEFEITLTNLTAGEPGMGGQIFSHPIFATHAAGLKLGEIGSEASQQMVALAEGGDVSGILELASVVGANSVVADGVVIPDGSVTVKITGNAINSSLSIASMLVSTNDAFILATDVPLYDEAGMPLSTTLELMSYDAGSENNTELASDIPGPLGLDADADPPESNERSPEGGVITPHPGIQGVGDVSEAFAWTEPTATLTIKPVSIVETPVVPESSFDVTLAHGLNMISIPLMSSEPSTAKSLAMMLGASIVIKLDAATQRFVGYSYAEEGDGFDIDGSSGYIVNTPAGGDFTFTGTAWRNQSDAAAAPQISTMEGGWAFVVTSDIHDIEIGESYTVTAKNLRTGVIASEKVTTDRKTVSAVWADMNRKSVVELGDTLEITLLDEDGTIVSGPFERTVQTSDIHKAYLTVQLRVGDVRPKETMLRQNFPNPFNPETWIPYQLSHDSNVTIQIFDVSGYSVRTLNLGHQAIGSYMTTPTAAYWDGKNGAGEPVSSGIYFYTLQTDKFSATRRMVILK